MKSKFLQLAPKDIFKGFITAVLTVIITGLYASLQKGELPVDWVFWKAEITLGLSAGIAYLIKNFFTSSEDKFLKSEPK